MSEDHESSSSETRPRPRKRRARVACYQCKARRIKCNAAPSDTCTPCVTNNLHCDWPPEGMIKKRGRKPSNAQSDPSAVPSNMAGQSSMSSLPWHPPPESNLLNNQNLPTFHHIFAESSTMPSGSVNIDPANTEPGHVLNCGFLAPYSAIFSNGTSSDNVQRDAPWMSNIQDFQEQLRSLDPGQLQTEMMAMGMAGPGEVSASPFDWAALLEPRRTPRDPGSNSTTDHQPAFPSHLLGLRGQESGGNDARDDHEGIVATAKYTRSHGSTAVRPGREHGTLHIRPSPFPLTAAPRVPHEAALMGSFVDIFFDKFACQFPALQRGRARDLLQKANHTQSPFLLYAIAALSARFSSNPTIALPHLRPYQYGEIYKTRAMSMIGMMLTIPSHETVLAFLLLALASLGGGSSTETWMLMGLAVRMCQDMELHKKPSAVCGKSESVLRAERLTFWSVVITDYALCLMEGRTTSILAHTITQDLPSEDDFRNMDETNTSIEDPPRHPFPFVTQTMLTVGPLIESLNSADGDDNEAAAKREQTLSDVCSQVAEYYDDLYIDDSWNAANLQLHTKSGRGSLYLYLHVFSHAIQCLREDVGLHRESIEFSMSGETKGARQLSFGLRAKRWLHSPRFIGDMLVLANLMDPTIYLSMPLISQCFFLAGKAFGLEKRSRHRLSSEGRSSISPREDREMYKNEIFQTLTNHNIGYFRQALTTMSKYWVGVTQMNEELQRFTDGENEDTGLPAEGSQTSATVNLAWIAASDLPADLLDTSDQQRITQLPMAPGDLGTSGRIAEHPNTEGDFSIRPMPVHQPSLETDAALLDSSTSSAKFKDFWSMLFPADDPSGVVISNEGS